LEEQEDPDCEPPAPKKKKKRDKLAVDLVNDHIDLNGSSNDVDTPEMIEKMAGEVSGMFLLV